MQATTVTLTFTLAELASINDALAVRCALSSFPRPGHQMDRLNEADYDRANNLEKQTFAVYATYQEREFQINTGASAPTP